MLARVVVRRAFGGRRVLPLRLPDTNAASLVPAAGALRRFSSGMDAGDQQPSRWGLFGHLRLRKHIEKFITQKAGMENRDAARLVASAGVYAAYGSLALTLLGTIGVDTSPLVAGVGITGATIGLAARDTVNNLICGFTLIFFAQIRRGAKVTIAGQPGIVNSVELSRVVLKSEETGDLIIIPSAKAASGIIVVHQPPS